MSITTLREELKGISGAERLVMNYEDGGKVQVFSIDDVAVRVGPNATIDEIKEAFRLKTFKKVLTE
ncbi:hypothetical protein [uncultured Bradyrhizobium sp.]|uniref:hypothetical protein n=1 Tax=uncultured Bradyrhizobium sp. TaxID=199684 RepID=UPI0035CB9686